MRPSSTTSSPSSMWRNAPGSVRGLPVKSTSVPRNAFTLLSPPCQGGGSFRAADLLQKRCFLLFTQKRSRNGIRAQPREIRAAEIQRARAGEIVFEDVASEVRRVVGVDCDAKPRVEQLLEVMVLEALEHLELDVRQRAHREGNALRAQALHQRRFLDAAHAVVDADR